MCVFFFVFVLLIWMSNGQYNSDSLCVLIVYCQWQSILKVLFCLIECCIQESGKWQNICHLQLHCIFLLGDSWFQKISSSITMLILFLLIPHSDRRLTCLSVITPDMIWISVHFFSFASLFIWRDRHWAGCHAIQD